MLLANLKGEQAFKAMGKLVGCFRDMFTDEKLQPIAAERKTGWILDFFAVSLEERSDIWLRMFLILNPEMTEDEVNIGAVIKFAYDVKSDEQIMTLFFSQSEQTAKQPSGSPTEITEETEAT